MSHEIRTSMNGIIGMLDLALDESPSDTIRNRLLTCKSSADALLTIINDILDMSKIEAGKMSVEVTDCSLNRMLIDIESLMEAQATEKGIEFSIIFDTAVPEQIRTDITRVRQCILNLIGNGIKFTDTGHVHLRLSMQDDKENATIRFDVEDTGIGISSDKQNGIFDKFSQADNTIARRFGGTGLGLTITKLLSQLLGGSLSLTSEGGRGSTFSLVIPAGVDIESQNLIAELNRCPVTHNQQEKNIKLSGKILVVEDNKVNQEVIIAILKKIGLQVTMADDGCEAVQKAISEQFDLILMDMHMPNMSGFEATKSLRRSGLEIPIIALTASVTKKDVDETLASGCNEHLPKPINRKELIKVINNYLSAKDSDLSIKVESVKSEIDEIIQTSSGQQSQQNEFSVDVMEDNVEIPIDLSIIMNNVEEEDLAMDVIQMFSEDAPKIIQTLEEAIENKASEDVQLHAHSLKGISAMVAANRLKEKAYQLECAGEQKNTEAFDLLFDDLKESFDEIMLFLSKDNWVEIVKKQNNNKQ